MEIFVDADPAAVHNDVVLGPNGTGKSSIVCAICVGLNGNLSVRLMYVPPAGLTTHLSSRSSDELRRSRISFVMELKVPGSRCDFVHMSELLFTCDLPSDRSNFTTPEEKT